VAGPRTTSSRDTPKSRPPDRGRHADRGV